MNESENPSEFTGEIPNIPQQLVSSKELAAELGVTPGCINIWRRDGKIRAAFVCQHTIRYNRAEVMAALFGPGKCLPEFCHKQKPK